MSRDSRVSTSAAPSIALNMQRLLSESINDNDLSLELSEA